MIKEANNTWPIHEIIMKRWSPRAFLNKPVDKEQIMSFFEAARWAASAGNTQPWRFVFASRADNKVVFDKIFDCVSDWNKNWVKEVPLLIVAIANTINNNKPLNYAHFDTGSAVTSLLLQATSLGLFAHPFAGFDKAKTKQVCNIPDNFEPLVMIAVGHYGDPNLLNEELKTRELAPRIRKELSELVFENEFMGGGG